MDLSAKLIELRQWAMNAAREDERGHPNSTAENVIARASAYEIYLRQPILSQAEDKDYFNQEP
jgi:hypothetical protein